MTKEQKEINEFLDRYIWSIKFGCLLWIIIVGGIYLISNKLI